MQLLDTFCDAVAAALVESPNLIYAVLSRITVFLQILFLHTSHKRLNFFFSLEQELCGWNLF